MTFATDLLDEFCIEAGFVDWEIIRLSDESPYYGDYVVRFIEGPIDN